jgi:amino acid transporter
VVIIAGFLPMFFAAYVYREFNKIMPDAGTSFTWTSKAIGPYIGWRGGGHRCSPRSSRRPI